MKKEILVNEIIKKAGIIKTTSSRHLEYVFYKMMKSNKSQLERCYLSKEDSEKFANSILTGIS